MRQVIGFTLIEIILVVVVIGILSAVAVPRFVDFTQHGNEARLNSVKATVVAAVNLYYAKALAKGKLETGGNATFNINIDSSNTITAFSCTESGNTYYPYPDLGESGAIAKIVVLEDSNGVNVPINVANDTVDAAGCGGSDSNRYRLKIGTSTTDCFFYYDGTSGDITVGTQTCS